MKNSRTVGRAHDPTRVHSMVERFKERCRASGLKLTHQRLAIFEALARDPGHPSAERLHDELRRSFPTLSLMTVYRTLQTFEELGLISKANPIHAAARFDANQDRHHHVVCRRCQRVEDVYEPALDAIRVPSALARRYRDLEAEVAFVGLCSVCSSR
jgi:Fur family peroxide stress response transcriptional regulator